MPDGAGLALMNMRQGDSLPKVVTIGGGTGSFVVLSGLKKYPVSISAIVSMMDDGGSTGRLRDEYGVLPAGDIRRALVALSSKSAVLRDLFNYRFESGGLHGHNFGNIFLAALQKVSGSFTAAVAEASRILDVRGTVVPVTTDDCRLVARLKDGSFVVGETNIDIAPSSRAAIEEVRSEPAAEISADAAVAIRGADMIIVGPGDLYTSVVPNLLVRGVSEEIMRSSAVKVYVGNLMTKRGETDGFRAGDFLSVLSRYGFSPDVSLWNSVRPPEAALERYLEDGAEWVAPPPPSAGAATGDFLQGGEFIRHDSDALARSLFSLLDRIEYSHPQ